VVALGNVIIALILQILKASAWPVAGDARLPPLRVTINCSSGIDSPSLFSHASPNLIDMVRELGLRWVMEAEEAIVPGHTITQVR
jgi:hypothetical protein